MSASHDIGLVFIYNFAISLDLNKFYQHPLASSIYNFICIDGNGVWPVATLQVEPITSMLSFFTLGRI